MLQRGQTQIIPSDRVPSFTGQIVQWITEMEGTL